MKLEIVKSINISEDDKLYGIIGVSRRTYEGVYEIEVETIDWSNECVIFTIEQPCRRVRANFDDFEYYIFKTKEEADNAYKNIAIDYEGIYAY
jgi:hypothetical protein